jgi:hypothetical protein
MKQPDRFDEMVLSHSYDEDYIPTCEAVKLLRRQHAAYVRMVKRCQHDSQFPYNHHMQAGSQNAFEMILADLARYRKGTR